MLKKQDYKCAICRTLNSGNKIFKHLSVDHDHNKVFKVRGLLCQLCNHGLGNFKDNIKRLQAAIKYLKLFEEKCK